MTPEQRRAHLILHGKTLLDAWKLYARALKQWREADKQYDEAHKPPFDKMKFYKASKQFNKAHKQWTKALAKWNEAVKKKFSSSVIVEWRHTFKTCTLSVGEVYTLEDL